MTAVGYFVCSLKKHSSEFCICARPLSSKFRRRLRPLHHPAAQGGPPPPLSRGRKREKGTRRAQTQRARSQIAEIPRPLLRRLGPRRARLLRLFRFLARLPLSAMPACSRLLRRLHRLHRNAPQRRGRPLRRRAGSRADAHPERRRRTRAGRVAERILHRDLGQVAKGKVA